MPDNKEKRTFKLKDKTIDIPSKNVDAFLERYPDAQEMASYIIGKDTVDIPIENEAKLLERYPNAKPTYGVKKKEQPEPSSNGSSQVAEQRGEPLSQIGEGVKPVNPWESIIPAEPKNPKIEEYKTIEQVKQSADEMRSVLDERKRWLEDTGKFLEEKKAEWGNDWSTTALGQYNELADEYNEKLTQYKHFVQRHGELRSWEQSKVQELEKKEQENLKKANKLVADKMYEIDPVAALGATTLAAIRSFGDKFILSSAAGAAQLFTPMSDAEIEEEIQNYPESSQKVMRESMQKGNELAATIKKNLMEFAMERTAKANERLEDNAIPQTIQEIDDGLDALRYVANSAVEGVGQIPLAYATMGGSSFVMASSMMYQQAVEQEVARLEQGGMSRDEALAEAIKDENINKLALNTGAFISAGLDYVGSASIFGKGATNKVKRKIIKEILETSTTKKIISQGLKVGKSLVVENATELGQELLIEPETVNIATGGKLGSTLKDITVEDALNVIAKSTIGAGSANVVTGIQSKKTTPDLLEVVDGDEKAMQFALEEIDRHEKNGRFTTEEADNLRTQLSVDLENYKKIKNLIPKDKMEQGLKLQREYEAVTGQIATTSGALAPMLKIEQQRLQGELLKLAGANVDENGKVVKSEPKKVATEPRVLSSPTNERYAVVNRNDGKGDVYLTKEEYENGKIAKPSEKKKESGAQPTQEKQVNAQDVPVEQDPKNKESEKEKESEDVSVVDDIFGDNQAANEVSNQVEQSDQAKDNNPAEPSDLTIPQDKTKEERLSELKTESWIAPEEHTLDTGEMETDYVSSKNPFIGLEFDTEGNVTNGIPKSDLNSNTKIDEHIAGIEQRKDENPEAAKEAIEWLESFKDKEVVAKQEKVAKKPKEEVSEGINEGVTKKAKKSVPQDETKEVTVGKKKFTIKTGKEDVKVFKEDGTEVKEYTYRKVKGGKKKKVKNANFSSIVSLATGEPTDNQVNEEKKKKWNEVREHYTPTTAHEIVAMEFANGARVSRKSIKDETGEKAKNIFWAVGGKEEKNLPSVENLSESLWEQYGEELGIDDTEFRDAIISVLTSYKDLDAIRTELTDNYNQSIDTFYGMSEQEQIEAHKQMMTDEERALFDSIEIIDNLTESEKRKYYEEEYAKSFDSLTEDQQREFYEQYARDERQRLSDKDESNEVGIEEESRGEQEKEKVSPKPDKKKEKVKVKPDNSKKSTSQDNKKPAMDEEYFTEQTKKLQGQPTPEAKITKAKAIIERLRQASKEGSISETYADKKEKSMNNIIVEQDAKRVKKAAKKDKVEQFLDEAIEATSTKNRAFEATLGLPLEVLNASLKAIRAAYKAGKSLAEAIQAGLKYLKDNGHKVNEKDFEKAAISFNQEQTLREELSEAVKEAKSSNLATPQDEYNAIMDSLKKGEWWNSVSANRQKNMAKVIADKLGAKVNEVSFKDAKKQKKEFESTNKEVEEEAKKLSGIKKDLIPEEDRGKVDIKRMSFQQLVDMAKPLVDNGTINPRLLIEELIENPRPLRAIETAAMVYYKAKLDNKIDAIVEKLEIARKAEDNEKVSSLEMLLAEAEALRTQYHQMQEATAYEQGIGLAARKMLLNREYSLESQVRKFKANTGLQNVPAETMAKFEMYDEKLKQAEKEIEQLERKLKETEGKLEVLNVESKTNYKRKAKRAADKVRKAKIVKAMKELSSLQSTVLPIPQLWDATVETIATTIEVTGSIVQSVANGLNHIKNSDWYKGLSEKGKRKADEILSKALFEEATEKMAIAAPTLKDGELYIPDSFVKQLIKEGHDTIEKAVPEAMRLINENNLLEEQVTEEQVMHAISDYGKRSKLSKDEIDVALRKMKRMGKALSALADVRKKKKPLRSGRERDKLTQQEREIQREINELLKDIPQSDAELESEWKSALDATKTRLKNRKEDLLKQIERGKRERKEKKSIKLDVEAMQLKEEVAELDKLLEAIDSKAKMTPEQKARMVEESLIKSIEEKERRIKEKDFTPIPREKVSTPKIDKLREKSKALSKEYEALKQKSALGRDEKARKQLKQIEKQIEKVQEQILLGIADVSKQQAKPELNANVVEAKKRLQDLRELLASTDAAKALAEKKKLELTKKNLKKSIEKYKQRIKDKEFATKKPQEKVLDEEAKKLAKEQRKWKEEFDLEQEKHRLANRSWSEKWSDSIVDILGIPRSMMASMDFSAPLRQGFILSTRNPRTAAKAFKEMFLQAFSQERNEKWMRDLKETEEYATAKRMGLYISDVNAQLLAKEEQFTSNIAERIGTIKINGKRWGYGSLVKGSNRAYSAYLNVLRSQVYFSFADKMKARGYTEEKNPEIFKDMAAFVNNATGRGSVGKFENAEKILNTVFFAPRYVVSRANILANTATGYASYSAPVRAEALKTMGAYVGTGMAILLLAMGMGADVEDDPRSPDFGKIRIGDLSLDIWAGLQPIVKIVAVSMSASRKSSVTGKIHELNTDGYKADNIAGEWMKFLRGKLSPITGTIFDAATAPKDVTKEWEALGMRFEGKVYFENIVGEEMTIGEKAIGLLSPMYARDIIEIAKKEGTGMTIGAGVPALFGVGTQYYERDLKSKKSSSSYWE